MTDAERYASKICSKYGVRLEDRQLDDKTYDTVMKVAREVLPDAEYRQWVDDLVVEVNLLRDKFGIRPHLIAKDYY